VPIKHDLKRALREVYARVLYHGGLHAVVDRCMPRRLTILAGHCVSAENNAGLPGDMKIDGRKLASMMSWFARRYEVTTVGKGMRRLRESGRRSLFALSMDDGYQDNVTHLLPILKEVGVSATVYLESRPLSDRRLNWSHKLAVAHERMGAAAFVRRYLELTKDPAAAKAMDGLANESANASYRVKRALKYSVDVADRDRVLDALFVESGGDERALCDTLYMTWDGARTLRDGGVELGGHTVEHHILSRLPENVARAELETSRSTMKRELAIECDSFAYPFGRRWDYDQNTVTAVRDAGFASAATTHGGTNGPSTDPYQLKRVMIDENARMHLLVAEACGGFDLLRRFGLDLSD
jgi:peptidoglycan/xylan/chitin deacetylase (PgdA/CDA1 family)